VKFLHSENGGHKRSSISKAVGVTVAEPEPIQRRPECRRHCLWPGETSSHRDIAALHLRRKSKPRTRPSAGRSAGSVQQENRLSIHRRAKSRARNRAHSKPKASRRQVLTRKTSSAPVLNKRQSRHVETNKHSVHRFVSSSFRLRSEKTSGSDATSGYRTSA